MTLHYYYEVPWKSAVLKVKPSTLNNKQTKYMQLATRLWFESNCSQILCLLRKCQWCPGYVRICRKIILYIWEEKTTLSMVSRFHRWRSQSSHRNKIQKSFLSKWIYTWNTLYSADGCFQLIRTFESKRIQSASAWVRLVFMKTFLLVCAYEWVFVLWMISLLRLTIVLRYRPSR